MSCTCDTRIHPTPTDIPPGLTRLLPRAIGRFDDFRQAMWAARAKHLALRDWSGQAPGDLGAMLLDFWAVVADVQAFYDTVRAEEAYIGTAPTQTLLRGLIRRLGYRPKPATAASAWIAVDLAGVRRRTVAGGTAFRSGPVGDEPPQIFETGADHMVWPALGTFDIDPPAPTSLAEAQGFDAGATQITGLWVSPRSLNAKPGDVIVLSHGATHRATRLSATRDKTFGNDGSYTELSFDPPVAMDPQTLAPDALTLRRPAQQTRLWSASDLAENPDVLATGAAVLSGLNAQTAAGDVIVAEGADGSLDVTALNTAREIQMTLIAAATTDASGEDEDGDALTIPIDTPSIKVPTTQLTFDGSLSIGGSAQDLKIGFGLITAAELASPPPDAFTAAPGDALPFQRGWRFRRRFGDAAPKDMTALLVDPFGQGGAVSATIDADDATLTLGDDAAQMELSQPVTAHANALLLTRGETVLGEILGTGDAQLANQSFKLKKPLTYLPAPSEAGYASTLSLRVDGIEVAEVPTLYAQPPEALVYTLSEDDEDATWVTFGDGTFGARPTTGAVITADYRSGGGAARPEAGSITQMVTPAPAVTTIHQPFEAFGGSDPESEDVLRTNAPRSALLLGRVISLADFEATALTQDGVSGAQATWAWSKRKQRPVAQVWYAGDADIAPKLSARLRAMSDPSTPIEVLVATPIPLALSLSVVFEATHRPEVVLAALRARLTLSSTARLAFAHPRIGMALFRSPVVAEALAVPGVRSLDAVQADGTDVAADGMACAVGHWFSIDPDLGGTLILNGEEEGA